MKVSITSEMDLGKIFKQIDSFVDDLEQELVDKLIISGKNFVENARRKARAASAFDGGSFGNITWNLRSSIGFVIVRNHEVVFRYFPTLAGAVEGSDKGLAYAEEIALLSDDGGIALIAVAGMEYALFVQRKGFDTIRGSQPGFVEEFKELVRSLK